jgi:hypothetical protein
MIVDRIRPYFERGHTRRPLPTEIKIANILHMMAHGSSFRGDSEVFGLPCATLHRAFHVFLNAMKTEFWDMIMLPKDEKRDKNRSIFEDKARRQGADWVPQFEGAVDGTHVEIRAPVKNSIGYINRKDQFSLNVQALVGANMEFLHLYIGAPGRVHDQNIFRESKLEGCISDGWMILGKPSID